jgi:hypothetical protein
VLARLAVASGCFLVLAFSLGDWSRADGFPPPSYSAKEIRATVVDETTGTPVSSVVVVAHWILRRPGGQGPTLHLAETTTDDTGHFLIPPWGPKLRPPSTRLGSDSPELLLFKSGYIPLSLPSKSKASLAASFPKYMNLSTRGLRDLISDLGVEAEAVHDSVWDGLTIQLEPFTGSADQWLDHLRIVLYQLDDHTDGEPVRRTQRLLDALAAEEAFFHRQAVSPGRELSVKSLFSRIAHLRR